MDDRSARAKEIFLDALERPASEQFAFVQQSSDGDASLLARVTSLLSSHSRDNQILDRGLPLAATTLRIPIDDVDTTRVSLDEHAPSDATAAESIDGYRLLRPLGQGGFGVVWLAEQVAPLRRQVALKLLLPDASGALMTPSAVRELIARFEAERQTLAVLDHPNIAKVFDAGTVRDGPHKGRPYFVMEYVQGLPITRYCTLNELSVAQRVELMIDVCTAVQHAHQRGTIHRDLKPGNTLVSFADGKHVPKVIDFGVAKAVGGSSVSGRAYVTQHLHVVGTPQYMSPEQAMPGAGAQVDTRSDVYALGAVLYELLTGTPPIGPEQLEGKPLDEICRVIREQPVTRPSLRANLASASRVERAVDPTSTRSRGARVTSGTRNELDWIVMTALEKAPARRYQSAHAMAADLRRYLDGETITAAPPSRMYRFRKFAGRHRKTILASSLVLVALVLGLIGTSIGFVRARREANEAARQTAIASAVNDFLNDELLAAAAPSAEKGKGRDVMLLDVLNAASQRIESASAPGGKFAGLPAVQAALRRTIGNTYEGLGKYNEALQHLDRAHDLHVALFGEEDLRTLAVVEDQIRALQGAFKYNTAEQLARRVLATYRKQLGPADERTLRVAQRLAGLLDRLDRHDEAMAVFVEAINAMTAAGGVTGQKSAAAARLLRHELAMRAANAGNMDGARQQFLGQLDDYRKAYGADDPQTLKTQVFVAVFLSLQGPPDKAEELFRDALDRMRRILGPVHPSTIDCAAQLAAHLIRQQRLPDADRIMQSLLEAAARAGDEPARRYIAVEINRLHRPNSDPEPSSRPASRPS